MATVCDGRWGGGGAGAGGGGVGREKGSSSFISPALDGSEGGRKKPPSKSLHFPTIACRNPQSMEAVVFDLIFERPAPGFRGQETGHDGATDLGWNQKIGEPGFSPGRVSSDRVSEGCAG
ncbi:uncharacterized [Tachysurus ichikawai]